jgi:hypothetical protein
VEGDRSNQAVRKLMLSGVVGLVAAMVMGNVGQNSSPPVGAAVAFAQEAARNACGCYRGAQGMCYCDKKAKCGCPGECEPKGCEEQRSKEIEREIEAETKKAAEAARRQQDADKGEGSTEGRETPQKAAAPKGKAPSETPVTARTAAPRIAPAPKMTPAQRKQLARLLGLYLAENPEGREKTAEEIRSDVESSAAARQ